MDPDRSQAVLKGGAISSWNEFLADATTRLAELEHARGDGLCVLTGALSSPTLLGQLDALRGRFPLLRHHVWQPWPRDNLHAGLSMVFGEPLEPLYHFDRAEVIVALDADFLGGMPDRVRHARDFIDGRRIGTGPARMSRLYVAEPTPSLTGSMADHRLALGSRDIAGLARQLAAQFGVGGGAPALPEAQQRWADALVKDLRQHAGAALVLAGEAQPAEVHALAHAINAALAGPSRTVEYVAPVARTATTTGSIHDLAAAMAANRVGLLLMLDVNPVWDAPADLQFGRLLGQVPCSIHLGQYADETGAASRWHIPQAHALESWSDLRACDGTVSLVQPLLEPLYGGRTAHEVVGVFQGRLDARSRELVREHWRTQVKDDFERWWSDSLRQGLIAGSAAPKRQPALRHDFAVTGVESPPGGLELLFRPDPTIWDGRYANNGWLQELPKPTSQLTWGNVVLVGTALAKKLKLANGDEVRLRLGQRELLGPAWVSEAQAENSVTVCLGHGRERAGRMGSGVGFDAYRLRTSDALWHADGLTLERTGGRSILASTQHQFRMEGREPVRTATLEQFLGNARVVRREARVDGPFPSLYAEHPQGEYAWGMHIDLNACIGCKVCTIACQAENNIPVVGAEQVKLGRAMHWIRVDQYDDDKTGQPHSLHQPVPCMHCEHAPCELVCPVGATVHDSEGLNLQVYNRCVGTRFCSNNCPYKVRRFNFEQFSDTATESLKGQRNPQVTVRNRGVMEKCTYCIQRIRVVEIAAEKENRPVRDGEVRTACEAACPTQAIRFGNLRDPASAVLQAKSSPLHYTLLAELNTRPRTTYSARLRNPNPALDEPEQPA